MYGDLSLSQDDEVCDYYAINSEGKHVLAKGYGCTGYLELSGADSMTLSMAQTPSSDYGLAFYNADKEFISFVPSPDGEDIQKKNVDIAVPEGAVYFRTTYFNFETRKQKGEFSYALKKDGEKLDEKAKKRDYQDGYVYFSRKVDQSLGSDLTDIKMTTGVLALPENYSADGEKTKLIIYFHGYSHYVYYGAWGSTESFRAQKEYFLSRGYAVLDCNGARDNDRKQHFTSAGSPQYVDGYYQCYKYAIENYNIDENVFVIGGSAGGPAAINFVRWHQDSVRTLQLVSAWTDVKVCHWGQSSVPRYPFVEYIGFKSESEYEADKMKPYDPAYMIKTDKDGDTEYIDEITVPVNGIIGGSVFYSPFIRWMKAMVAGNEKATLKVWQGKTHSIVSGADVEIDGAVCDFFDRY